MYLERASTLCSARKTIASARFPRKVIPGSQIMPQKRGQAHKLPDPLKEGEILVDSTRREWKLGPPLASGGFGLIYKAAESPADPVTDDAQYVVKIEPHDNGPLFTEINFYQRAADPKKVDAWLRKRKLPHLGVPRLIGYGSHDLGKYRFLVMQRFGDDIWRKFCACNKTFPVRTVFALTLQVLESLEYIHSHGYAHADIKSANLLLGSSEEDQNKVYLVDFGLAKKYQTDDRHREYKEEPKKGHDGTPEFTSIDAHKGAAASRRGDIQIMAYVMLQWMCTKLPWEDNLTDLKFVMDEKIRYSTDVRGLLQTCFARRAYPDELAQFLDHAFQLSYDARPDYERLKNLCNAVLVREGVTGSNCLSFTAQRTVLGDQDRDKQKRSESKRMPSQDDVGGSSALKEGCPKKISHTYSRSNSSPAAGASKDKTAEAKKPVVRRSNTAPQTVEGRGTVHSGVPMKECQPVSERASTSTTPKVSPHTKLADPVGASGKEPCAKQTSKRSHTKQNSVDKALSHNSSGNSQPAPPCSKGASHPPKIKNGKDERGELKDIPGKNAHTPKKDPSGSVSHRKETPNPQQAGRSRSGTAQKGQETKGKAKDTGSVASPTKRVDGHSSQIAKDKKHILERRPPMNVHQAQVLKLC